MIIFFSALINHTETSVHDLFPSTELQAWVLPIGRPRRAAPTVVTGGAHPAKKP